MVWGVEEYRFFGIFLLAIAMLLLAILLHEKKPKMKHIIAFFYVVVLFLVSAVFILSPEFNKYILVLNPNETNAGSSAVIISITLGLAFCGPIFYIILELIRDKK